MTEPFKKNLSIFFTLLCLGVLTFLFYAPLGFNPTDEGLVLAYTRRIIDGQIPHKDFISVLPAGFALLHLHLFYLFDEHLFIAARGWATFQFVIISLIWCHLIFRTSQKQQVYNLLVYILIALITFTFSIHNFPLMSWYTIDGLFLSSIGILLIKKKKELFKIFGYFLLGYPAICKHNFVLVIPLVLLVLGDIRKLRFWIAACTPGFIYLALITSYQALPELLTQLLAHTSFIRSAFFRYYKSPNFAIGAIVSFISLILISKSLFKLELSSDKIIAKILPNETHRVKGQKIALALFALSLTYLSVRLGMKYYFWRDALLIFGLGIFTSLYLFLKEEGVQEQLKLLLCATILAWTASISVGYNTPALMAGPLLAFFYIVFIENAEKPFQKCLQVYLPIILIPIILFSFHSLRSNRPYRDLPRYLLSHELPETIKGLNGIYSNKNLKEMMLDLNEVLKQVSNQNFAIVPDFPTFWVKSKKQNPLSIDWAQPVQLPNSQLVQRVNNDIDSLLVAGGTVIVQKYQAQNIKHGKIPIKDKYEVVNYIKSKYSKVNETEFFELYRLVDND